jgi:aspartate aminotransferase
VVAAINAIPGLDPVPDGAFYCMVDAAPLMGRFGDDEALCLHLLEHGVAVVPASAFGGRDGFPHQLRRRRCQVDRGCAPHRGRCAASPRGHWHCND